jgi:Ser/Thr protein kinase RdoA (MazF antagonist)
LNSYENRVYQIGIEGEQPIIAKFYRPGRWRDAQIVEEHDYSLELQEREIPVVAPLRNDRGESLFNHLGYRFALFPRRGGRWPELDNNENLAWLGRFIGRIHAVGAIHRFDTRVSISSQSMGRDAIEFIAQNQFLPDYLRDNFLNCTDALVTHLEQIFDTFGPTRIIRLHGDCHPGNILWTEKGPHFVDLDDCVNGPAVQDLWMLLSGDRETQQAQLRHLIDGYNEFFEFDPFELNLIEALRTLRMLNYSAWLARRWSDPAFPKAFPWFNTPNYWETQLNDLREQQERLYDPCLELK